MATFGALRPSGGRAGRRSPDRTASRRWGILPGTGQNAKPDLAARTANRPSWMGSCHSFPHHLLAEVCRRSGPSLPADSDSNAIDNPEQRLANASSFDDLVGAG